MNQTYKATLSQHALPQFLPTWGGKGGVIWEDLEVCSLKTMMFEKYPSISPYTYCSNNPVNKVDPTGMNDDEWVYDIETKELIWISDLGGEETQTVTFAKSHENGGKTAEGTVTYDGAITDMFSFNPLVTTNVDWGNIIFGASNIVGGATMAIDGFTLGIGSEGMLSNLAIPLVMGGLTQGIIGYKQIAEGLGYGMAENNNNFLDMFFTGANIATSVGNIVAEKAGVSNLKSPKTSTIFGWAATITSVGFFIYLIHEATHPEFKCYPKGSIFTKF